ncbi:ATP-binding protein [Acidithiobacillus sulfurivorans]|uniref:ATP-binding protein n=1 Tax=Acidithiobacillus sulfurivorans TaxID=1958756 RepID=A0ABS6A133_9PROT|nr:ATP-binding protein [Acidithiobacillus sulfurivorans]MBU2761082.1 ATP-binding protein [Acidithiobacillus sulfurivorans]
MLRPFELDPQIIHHIIYSQAGSIGKALIELLMNSIDAQATTVALTMDGKGFTCSDDGAGFATREDVLRYFGRFGTPHEEGDATYGRFRLGRGQIMAHASTIWRSHGWQMTVDTREMGYAYDLEDISEPVAGCQITGSWYEPLTEQERLAAIQEVRDLVRYTPIEIILNGKLITRNPALEKWDHVDDFGYYRAKEEGAVAIYNQGVLVRHDPGHVWGAGGLIVSKRAIGLNVSRTEILRKTDPVWKHIAKVFAPLAARASGNSNAQRKTEAYRERCARALLSGDPELHRIYDKEPVVTILPGKKHYSMNEFLRQHCNYHKGVVQNNRFAVVENERDIPQAEAMAASGMAVFVHPITLSRFGLYNALDFVEVIGRIQDNLRDHVSTNDIQYWGLSTLSVPALLSFDVLKKAFKSRIALAPDNTLDKETRRAWVALKWCLEQYAAICTGGEFWYGRRTRGGIRFRVFLGDSNTAEAWTDGSAYIAIDRKQVLPLKTKPLETAMKIFSLVEHEISHQGDSLSCGHDEAFYQRFHDLVLEQAAVRQKFLYIWLKKYTSSMENAGKRPSGVAWRERLLQERMGNGRVKNGLDSGLVAVDDAMMRLALESRNEDIRQQDSRLQDWIEAENNRLIEAGLCPLPPEWETLVRDSEKQLAEDRDRARVRDMEDRLADEHWGEMIAQDNARDRQWYAEVLGILPEELPDAAFDWYQSVVAPHYGDPELMAEREDFIRSAWHGNSYRFQTPKPWEHTQDEEWDPWVHEQENAAMAKAEEAKQIPEDWVPHVQDGETRWTIEHNAAAAGFLEVLEYLEWRDDTLQDATKEGLKSCME